MIIEYTKVLIQNEDKVFNADGNLEPHLINGVRYYWTMRSECMKYRETFREWILRKEERLKAPNYKDMVGVVIYDMEGVAPLPEIGEDGKTHQYGSMIIRYAYLDNTKMVKV